MYPEELIAPMRSDLTQAGFSEIRTAEEVTSVVKSEGSTLYVVNSVCGCAAGNARPGVKMAVQHSKIPDRIATSFAGNDIEAVNKVREYMAPYPPSSPAIALFKDGELVHMLERHHIEGRPAQLIAENLVQAFEEYC